MQIQKKVIPIKWCDVTTDRNSYANYIGFESKSFYGEAVLTERNYPEFELVAEDASGGGEFRLNVYCDDGQSIEGTVEDKEELINELFDYLVEKGAIKEK